jgi:hypothetical protein
MMQNVVFPLCPLCALWLILLQARPSVGYSIVDTAGFLTFFARSSDILIR